ncbi:Pleckstrin-likey domain-containing family M member 2, partial [Ophiophagus hannah]
LAKKKKTSKKKKVKPEEAAVPSLPAPAGDQAVAKEAGRPWATPESSLAVSTETPALCQLGLQIPEMKDTAMERVGQALSKVIDSLEVTDGWSCPLEPPDQPFRTSLPGEPPSPFGRAIPWRLL